MIIRIPSPLRRGDQVRIVALADSATTLTREQRKLAAARLTGLGLRVTFSEYCFDRDVFDSSVAEMRVADLMEGFVDPAVRGIIVACGGYASNQLLPLIDVDVVRANPKVFCGYSDITVLNNALLARAGLMTYSGPLFSTFGMRRGFGYTLGYFRRVVMSRAAVVVQPSATWSDDAWDRRQQQRRFVHNSGPVMLRAGRAVGRIVGGNLCSLNLLQGTAWMPSLRDAVVFVEDDDLPRTSGVQEFTRNLVSLFAQPDARSVCAVVFGRFQRRTRMTMALLRQVVELLPLREGVPVIANVNFGHTTPQCTVPIGGMVSIRASKQTSQIIFHHR